jgi:hypothetical protein
MAGMKPPIVPDQPVPIVPEDGLRRLLAACAGKDFEVASWPTTSDLGLTDGTRQMLEDLLRLGDQLTEDPERASPGQVATQSWPSRHSEADGQGSTREPASMSGLTMCGCARGLTRRPSAATVRGRATRPRCSICTPLGPVATTTRSASPSAGMRDVTFHLESN